MRARFVAALVAALGLLVPIASPVMAGDCQTEGGSNGNVLEFTETCATDPGGDPGNSGPNAPADDSPDPYTAYKWVSVCASDPNITPADLDCAATFNCPDPEHRPYQLWGRLPDGAWMVVTTGCHNEPPAIEPPVVEPPTVTPGNVLTALRRVGLPELTTVVQPAGKTLVNFDTNFYTEPRPVTLTLTLLGQRVEVEATPARYRWDFGDGTSASTADPGAAYPELSVTHRYDDARVTVHPSVETTYTARFRVRGGDWQDVGGTVTAVGPTTALRVAEATGLLSGNHR